MNLLPTDCVANGGTPQGLGTACTTPQACCLPNGTCVSVDPLCCNDLGGTPPPLGGLACLGDGSGDGIDDACQYLDSVVCEPQAPNAFHPPTYWYDLTLNTPGFGRCDFHVRVLDPNPANYTNWSITPWPGNTWQFMVHQVGTEWWASWWDSDSGCPNAIFPEDGTTRFQFNHPGSNTWGDWTTTISNTSDPYNQVVDRSANHVGQADGSGYRVHVPTTPGVTQACCLPDGICVEIAYDDCVAQGGDPQGPGTICDMRICPLLKWAQPPVYSPAGTPDCFWGWDEASQYFEPPIVADDWLCDNQMPVTDLHWWGSYIGWQPPEPPPDAPPAFHIGLWTDVPGGPQFSHPGVMLREWIVPRQELNERVVGCDFYPGMMLQPEFCFKYDFKLPPGSFFYQEEACNIYWFSIAAIYSGPSPFPWGWKTRPHFFMDDAVRIFSPPAPRPGMPYMFGEPVTNPQGESWDMAFVVTTCQTKPYGDIVFPWDVVDVDDILCVLDDFVDPNLCSGDGDIITADFLCAQDGIIDSSDILAILAAFSDDRWCPNPCR